MKKLFSILLSLVIISGALCIFPQSITASAKTVKYVTTTKNYTIDGKVIFKLKLKRAVLTSSSSAAKKINKYLKKQQTKLKNEYLAFAKKCYYQNSGNLPHSLDSKITLVYNKNGKYSFKAVTGIYSGGAHPITTVSGLTFDKSSGKKISALSVINDRAKLLKKIKAAFKKKYGDNVYEWLNIGKTKLSTNRYYLKDNGIYAVYNQGGVAFMYGIVKVNYC